MYIEKSRETSWDFETHPLLKAEQPTLQSTYHNWEALVTQDVVMRQLISYLMGLYRLDKPGLHIAHPDPTAEETSAYTYNNHTVAIDEDGIVPLMDSSCSFVDNALVRFKFLLEVQ